MKKHKSGKVYKKWYFNTLSFEQYSGIGNAFYVLEPDGKKRKKVLPIQLKD
jgi:hypothetical protein